MFDAEKWYDGDKKKTPNQAGSQIIITKQQTMGTKIRVIIALMIIVGVGY
ncbi:MAG: hypothetical protein HS126_35080 [Anaerolineales bacterium]|nr:hypothetical protein [Anaerolineales bacterium]